MFKTSRSRSHLVFAVIAVLWLAIVLSGPILTFGIRGDFMSPASPLTVVNIFAWIVGGLTLALTIGLNWDEIVDAVHDWIEAGDEEPDLTQKQAEQLINTNSRLEAENEELRSKIAELTDPVPAEPDSFTQPRFVK